jgi:hypothetical protein
LAEPVAGGDLSQEQLAKVEEFIEEEEGSFNKYRGWLATFLSAVAVACSAFHLYAAYSIVRTDLLREIHVARGSMPRGSSSSASSPSQRSPRDCRDGSSAGPTGSSALCRLAAGSS